MQKYIDQRDDLYAGRMPRDTSGYLVVRDLLNRFLTFKQARVQTGELKTRSWTDYKATCERIAQVFGKTRAVEDLAADDFERLRADITEGRGPTAATTEIIRTGCVFNFAFEHGLIDKPIRYGAGFSPPAQKTVRMALQRNGELMFDPAELRKVIDTANSHLSAMVLLAINSSMGNQDIGMLPLSAINLQTRWVNFPRAKTAIPRRFPLWPETVHAIEKSIVTRPLPKREHEQYVLLTRKGQCWSKEDTAGTLSREFTKLLKRTSI